MSLYGKFLKCKHNYFQPRLPDHEGLPSSAGSMRAGCVNIPSVSVSEGRGGELRSKLWHGGPFRHRGRGAREGNFLAGNTAVFPFLVLHIKAIAVVTGGAGREGGRSVQPWHRFCTLCLKEKDVKKFSEWSIKNYSLNCVYPILKGTKDHECLNENASSPVEKE